MDTAWRAILWQQFGAAIEMLENAVSTCPDELWNDRSQQPEFWYIAYHSAFFIDYYLSDSADQFTPPAPFTLDELDPQGLPPRPYTKYEILSYLEHGRRKCRAAIKSLTVEKGRERRGLKEDLSFAELLLYNMRHVQHHAAQLNLLLRQRTASAPNWVAKASLPASERLPLSMSRLEGESEAN